MGQTVGVDGVDEEGAGVCQLTQQAPEMIPLLRLCRTIYRGGLTTECARGAPPQAVAPRRCAVDG